jgi:exopolyphosphatase / guanosine-5'-triphosphate,3'-diphosphate pyrophosphatase
MSMRIHLVRCASGVPAESWPGAGGARPLSEQGRAEATGLVDFLRGRSIERLISSPALRCRETLAKLAAERGLSVHVDDRFEEGAAVVPALRLLRSLDEAAVVCVERAELVALLVGLMGFAPNRELAERSEPGSSWWIEGDPPRATYFSPRRELAQTLPRLTRLRLHRLARRQSRGAPARIAVFELGSTALHLLVAEATATGDVQRLVRERVPWRQGGSLLRQEIPSEREERLVRAARALREQADDSRPEELVAVATAALREAKNARAVADAAGAALGAPVQILSPAEEARLVFQAVRGRVELGGATALGLDLGGGNLSVVVGSGEGVKLARTMPAGVARLFSELVEGREIDAETLRAVRTRVRELLEPQLDAIGSLGATRCVGVGGTVRAVARILAARGGGAHLGTRGIFVERPELAALGRELAAMDSAARERLAGVPKRRAELLPAGIEILVTALSLLRSEGFTLCDWGVREGIVLDTRRARAAPPAAKRAQPGRGGRRP